MWAFTVQEGKDPKNMSVEDIALQVLNLNSISPVEDRMAFSALLLIPGYESLKFMPFLKQCKQQWNTSTPKYADFWSAETVLQKLVDEPLNWNSFRQVREIFILCSRLLQLTRSIDLHRCWRVLARGYIFHQNQKERTSPGYVGAIAASACLTLH